MNRTYLLFFFFILSIFVRGQENLSMCSWNEQGTCRRHIIIAVDGSGPFFKAAEPCFQVKKVIKDLLNNKVSEEVAPQVYHELQNGIPFFDEATDDVSVFTFVMGSSDWKRFYEQFRNSTPSNFIPNVNKAFLHKVGTANGSKEVLSIIDKVFERSSYADGKEITLSHFVYPTILDVVPCTRPAEEYIFILVSDFVSGSYGSSKQDQDIMLRDVMCYNYTAFSNYMAYYKQLNSQFYRIDYFDYAPADRDGTPACYGYKIKPMVGKGSPENVSISIESDLDAKESSRSKYTFAPLKFKFTHNNHLSVSGISLEITKEDTELPLYNNMLALANDDGVLYMVETNEKVGVDTEHDYYILPKFSLPLSGLSFDDDAVLTLKFRFITRIVSDDAPVIPYVYVASRELAETEIDFIDENLRKLMTILSIVLLTSLFLFIAIWRGKRKIINATISHFAQKYVDVTSKSGTVELPCWFYITDNNARKVNVKGTVSKKNSLSFGGKSQLYVRLQEAKPSPEEGFTYSVNRNACTDFVRIPLERGGHFNFNIDIHINPDKVDVSKLHKCSIMLDFKVKSSFMGLFKHKEEGVFPQIYEFYFIEDLGRAWVGFDPGTSGSCMAVGNPSGAINNPNISMVVSNLGVRNETIIPSKLILDHDLEGMALSSLRPGVDYQYGIEADINWKGTNSPRFQSIKKLLGYKKADNDMIVVPTRNGKVKFTGVDIAHLLIKGLEKDLNGYLARLSQNERTRIIGDRRAKPQRAVVAIPNNYTLPKIQDMIESIRRLGTFKEIRFIYEAEGVLFNYLRKTFGQKVSGSEKIIVYDMGGATINLTIFQIDYINKNGSTYYHITTLGKIGYAVGGDNIDVALMEFVFNHKGLDQSICHSYQLENKTNILEQILRLKLNIINYKQGKGEALDIIGDKDNFTSFANRVFNMPNHPLGKASATDSIWMAQLLNSSELESGEKCAQFIVDDILNSPELDNFVYSKVKDAMEEILKYPEVKKISHIDKLIFAGRSTTFPQIKEIVEKKAKKKFPKISVWKEFDENEVKTSVAYGACWYGIYNGLVTIDNSRLSSAYGYKHTSGKDTLLELLLSQNSKFDENDKVSATKVVESRFDGDGNTVAFYQVMGSGSGKDLLAPEKRHKVVFLTSIPVNSLTKNVAIEVDRNNMVKCSVKFDTGDEVTRTDIDIDTRDITEENEWAYTFATENKDIPFSTFNNRPNPRAQRPSGPPIPPEIQKRDNNTKNKRRI